MKPRTSIYEIADEEKRTPPDLSIIGRFTGRNTVENIKDRYP
jgi:hypothetical protein